MLFASAFSQSQPPPRATGGFYPNAPSGPLPSPLRINNRHGRFGGWPDITSNADPQELYVSL